MILVDEQLLLHDEWRSLFFLLPHADCLSVTVRGVSSGQGRPPLRVSQKP